MTGPERLLAAALSEEGYLEKASNKDLDDKTANAGKGNWTKYARDLDALGFYHAPKNGYAWCAVFVGWCFVQSFGLDIALRLLCQPMGGYGAGCTTAVWYYKAKGQFYISGPQPGDQIFFTNDGGKTCCHTGIVERVEGIRIYTIEGNTSTGAGVIPNGGCVARKSYTLGYNKIAGYGRPDWTIIQDEEDDDMDKERFRELWQELRQDLQDNDSGDWSEQARQWAVESGLMKGDGKTADGEKNYMWEDMLTREQFVTVLYRFARMLGAV